MEIYRPLRAGICVYECARFFFLIGALLALRPGGETLFPWLAYAAPGSLFPLIALFWWLDFSRYGGYGPLYAAGKSICFFSAVMWCIFSQKDIINAVLFGNTSLFVAPGVLLFILPGDLLSVAAAIVIIKKTTNGGT